jgi:cell division protein FtsI/penicillin-binding protein 2
MEKHHHCIKRYWSREVLMTPIQLANMMATVANEGYYTLLTLSKDKRWHHRPKV